MEREVDQVNPLNIPRPPTAFMRLVCGDRPALEAHFHEVGTELVRWLRAFGLLGSEVAFLDVGCGCGRIAHSLVNEPLRAYVGFDRHPAMIRWCQQEITSRAPNFQFHWFDIKSSYGKIDGHPGSIEACSFVFPFREDEFDTCFASSVFTHMPISEVNHYLGEIHRVVRPGGRVFLSIFCSGRAPYSRDGNYCHSREKFIATVEQSGFLWEKKGPEVYGEEHNWYLLTRPHR